MHWHYQNLTADKRPKSVKPKPIPWHGRVFAHMKSEACARFEWSLVLERQLGVRLAITPFDDTTFLASVSTPLGSLYLGYSATFGGALQRWAKAIAGGPTDVSRQYGQREISVSFYDDTLSWNLWTDPHGWSRERGRVRDGSLNFADLLFGKRDYVSHEITQQKIRVAMPEGVYTGQCVLSEDVWKRPRWFPLRVRRAHIDMEKPIPFPGKGENSWDCGQDGLYGLTTEANSVGDAIGKIVANVMTTREKRGGLEWRPESHGAEEAL